MQVVHRPLGPSHRFEVQYLSSVCPVIAIHQSADAKASAMSTLFRASLTPEKLPRTIRTSKVPVSARRYWISMQARPLHRYCKTP